MVSPVAPAALARTLLVALFAALLAFAPPQARAQQLVTVTTTVTTTVTSVSYTHLDVYKRQMPTAGTTARSRRARRR